MAGDSSSGRYDTADGKMSMESVFVEHFMRALDDLRKSWMSEDEFNSAKFTMSRLYLIRVLPNKKRQIAIIKQWSEGKSELDNMPGLHLSEKEKQAYAGMEIVTEIVLFICEAFELVNFDITGPATTKEYQNAVLEIPDMPQDESSANEEVRDPTLQPDESEEPEEEQ